MRQCILIGLLGLVIALLAARPAMAQKDVLDNIILLGPAETLNLPGVNRIVERPEEKTPPRPYLPTIADVPTHRPLATRFEPSAGYILEEEDTLLGVPRGDQAASGSSGGRALPDALGQRPSLQPRGEVDAARRELDDAGPPGGLDIDVALERLVHFNRDLRTKYHEIPQARADTLTAGLRGNPIIFWSAGGTPYGRWSNQPGTRSYPLVITYLLDFTGRRIARVRMAQVTERVLEARYQDEVRLKAAELDMAFVEALAARAALAAARRASAVSESGRPTPRRRALDRTLSAISLRDAEDRLKSARHDLAALLDIPAEYAEQLTPRGALRNADEAPPIEVLLHIALNCRPDLVAQRLSVDRAHAVERMEYSRRIRDTYILYTPWDYEVGQTNQGERGVNTWGLALFAPLPLFDRNQGNIQRARLEISKMQASALDIQRHVADDVRAAHDEFLRTLEDQRDLETQVLPLIAQELEDAQHARPPARAGTDAYRDARREFDAAIRAYREAVVRHRRSLTRLNTAVGQRVVPCLTATPPPEQTGGRTLISREARHAIPESRR